MLYQVGVIVTDWGRLFAAKTDVFICLVLLVILCVKDKTSINTTNRRNSSFFLDYSKFQGQFCFFFFFPPQFPFLDFFVTF